VRCSDGMSSDHSIAADEDAPAPEPDPRLRQVFVRAEAAGLNPCWMRFKNPATGRGEGPLSLQIGLRSGRKTRTVSLHTGDEAGVLLQHPFERWTALGGYKAILDAHERRIVAAVTLRGTSLSQIPGVIVEPPDDPEPVDDSMPSFSVPKFWGPAPGPSTLTIADSSSELVLELRTRADGDSGPARDKPIRRRAHHPRRDHRSTRRGRQAP
jgi:hypothetical protein